MELIGREASNTGGYWLREVLPYESAKQALFPVSQTPCCMLLQLPAL